MRYFALAFLAACVGQPSPGGNHTGADSGIDFIDAGTTAADAAGSTADAGPQPGDGVVWFTWPAQQSLSDASWSASLTDIANHLPAQYGSTYWDSDYITAAHETSHGIHAHLRNYENTTGTRANALYVLGDHAALVIEPDLRKSQIAAYIPAPLRGPRFDTYITGQTAWDDTPLYVWDEWNAYVNGAVVGVDQVDEGKWNNPWQDAVMGPLEFTIYALATVQATAELDPSYDATQMRELFAWNARRAMNTFRQGRALPDFTWQKQDAYLETFRTDPAAEPLRAFARQTFGDAWTEEVLLAP